ncbi:S1 family peptidase [Xanthomonas campestris]|uniref:S1 family peptidase n=1 Tax=Xanthomonas campestris TaxID=339 RepID=UPI000E0FE664|nr:serine protease [Xanthomonas campestris]
MNLGIMEQLVHSTVRIETTLRTGGVSCGTGFFVNFLQSESEAIPAIVTNKHVIAGADTGKFHLTIATPGGMPSIGNHREFTLPNFESLWVGHPDPEVDLAVYLVGPLLNQVNSSGVQLFFVPLRTELIPKDDDRKALSTMEDVVMIGYPSGIWDSANNLPVIRRGITATHSAISWNGKTEFLTDIASFPGSSGSPVMLANLSGYTDARGNTFFGQARIRLLGVHYAGVMHTATGEIRIVTAPTAVAPIAVTAIPNNIGVAINSRRLLDFEPIIARIVGKAA